jgi:hypothetical protein
MYRAGTRVDHRAAPRAAVLAPHAAPEVEHALFQIAPKRQIAATLRQS